MRLEVVLVDVKPRGEQCCESLGVASARFEFSGRDEHNHTRVGAGHNSWQLVANARPHICWLIIAMKGSERHG